MDVAPWEEMLTTGCAGGGTAQHQLTAEALLKQTLNISTCDLKHGVILHCDITVEEQ